MPKQQSTGTTPKKRSPIITFIGVIVIIISTILGYLQSGSGDSTSTATARPPAVVATTIPAGTQVADAGGGFSADMERLSFQQGFGARKDFWQVYFTAPTGSSDYETYHGGIDEQLIEAINAVNNTLDIAAFEWNNPELTHAVIAAYNRGVTVRMVVDDEHTIEDMEEALEDGEAAPFEDIVEAGIPYVDDSRGGLMHNKFMIMDGTTVWTGSMNFTINGTYRNNNNMLTMRTQRAVAAYQAEFNEMFADGEFGSSQSAQNGASFTQDGVSIQIFFAPEDEPVPALIDAINNAKSSIRFMTFSFTLDDVGQAILDQANNGLVVEGVFNLVGSRTQYSELPLLFCAGLPILQDGNPYTLHHKVFIIDEETVLTGSFNISNNATESNDENMVIIQDRDIAKLYMEEFERVQSQATTPPANEIDCP